MAGKKAETTMTFAVTFKVPPGMNIPTIRALMKNALRTEKDLCIDSDAAVKIHLTNKEVSYAKR